MTTKPSKVIYLCPHCGEKLSFLDGTVIKMVARLQADTFACQTMIYIPAVLGQYGAIIGEGVKVLDGAVVDFCCINGACKKSLTAPDDESLAEIRMIDGKGHEYAVLFNRIYGRRATFLVDIKKTSVVKSFGEHKADHRSTLGKKLNYFGE